MAFFGLFGRRRRSTRSPRPRYVPGQRSRRYLERVAELEETERRRRGQKRATRPLRPSDPGYDDPTVPIPASVQREAERRWQARQRQERQEREKAERQAIRDRERQARSEAKMAARAEKARRRAIEAYMVTAGMSRAEAEHMVDREPDWSTYDYNANPRGVRRRSWPSTRTNPAFGAIAGEIAKDVVKGGLVAFAQEELKEWRTQMHEPPGGTRSVVQRHTRRNPARLEPNHADPTLREMSERFHGRPDQILHLDEDQRRPPPKHVVLIGQERATVYRTPRSSERSGADWEHEAGDVGGILRRNVGGRRLLVADEHGRVYLLQGSSPMKFDPDQGLVG